MARIIRLGDLCTGHGGFGPRPVISASIDVVCNGLGVVREGDALATHSNGDSSHAGIVASGSGSVFCNGRQLARAGDPVNCGSSLAGGSSDCDSG